VNADLRGASFKKAKLQDADFSGSQFGDSASATGIAKTAQPGTDFRGAELTGCRGLTREQLALIDESTKFPEYLVEKPAAPAPQAAAPDREDVAEVINPLRVRR